MENKTERKRGIRRKFILMVFSMSVVVLFLGISAGYIFGRQMLFDTAGKQQAEAARLISQAFKRIIDQEVMDVKLYAARPSWRNYVAEKNAVFEGTGEDKVREILLSVDKRWTSEGDNELLLEKYLRNEAAGELSYLADSDKDIEGIFLTDKFGGLVASSWQTDDFYQGDEEWWQRAYAGGRGEDFIGEIELNEIIGKKVMPIAVPVMNSSGEVAGVCRAELGARRLFEPISVLKIGKTGRAMLLDKEGGIIFRIGADLGPGKHMAGKDFSALTSGLKKWLVTDLVLPEGKKKVFYACAKVVHNLLARGGLTWWVFVERNAGEILAPLNTLVANLVLVSLFLIAVLVAVGFAFGSYFASPIRRLYEFTENAKKGELGGEITIKTGDEIEELAYSFTGMMRVIKEKQDELLKAKLGLEDWSKTLEKKVEERTSELTKAQEAAINMMEDLQEAKNELETANEELKKLNNLKSEFISTVSHELRTPLSITKEGIDLVLDEILGGITEKQRDVLIMSRDSIDRLARLINSLLDISRIEAGRVDLRKELVNIGEVASNVVDLFEQSAQDKGLDLRSIVPASIKVYADIDKITQVFINLVSNAVKFTNEGSIELSAKENASEIICTVSDAGIGIPKENLDRIFDKFQQFGRVSGPGEKGIGLGLSIAEDIVKLHKGKMWVDSEVGKGSRFYFTIPKHTLEELFRESIGRAIEEVLARSSMVSVIFVFIADFNKIKRSLAGEKYYALMNGLKKAMNSVLRKAGDVIVGEGEEMIIILYDCGREGAFAVKNRLEAALRGFLADNTTLSAVSVKLGFAEYPDEASTAEEILRKARARLEWLKK